jgi:transposase
MPPNSEAFYREIIAQLRQQLDAQTKQAQSAEQRLAYAEQKILSLEERLRMERIAKYGKRSETLSDLQLELLDLEPGVSSEEVAAESERAAITAPGESGQQDKPADKGKSKPRGRHTGRQKLPSTLERVEQIIACPAEQCTCGRCGQPTKVIGYEESEVLDVRPAEYFVHVIKREKRACAQCKGNGVSTAQAPERIAPKSLLADLVIIAIIISKYCESVPLYRQQATIRREAGLDIAMSTLDDAVLRVGELLIPIANAMKRELLAGSYIQADETPVDVQTHDKRGSNHQAYLWQYGSPGKGVVFDFRHGPGRRRTQAIAGFL